MFWGNFYKVWYIKPNANIFDCEEYTDIWSSREILEKEAQGYKVTYKEKL